MGIVHATRGANAAGVAAPAQRGRDRVRHRRGHARRPCRSTGAPWPPTTTPFATTSPRRSRGSPSSTSACASRAASPCPTRRVTHGRSRRRRARARLTVNDFEPIDVPPGRLLLQTVRSHDQFNTTIYGLDDRYRGVHGRPAGGVREPRRPRRARARRRRPRRHRQRVERRPRAPGRALPARRLPDGPRATVPPTSPRPTCSSRSTASPTAAARRRRRRSSSASSAATSRRRDRRVDGGDARVIRRSVTAWAHRGGDESGGSPRRGHSSGRCASPSSASAAAARSTPRRSPPRIAVKPSVVQIAEPAPVHRDRVAGPLGLAAERDVHRLARPRRRRPRRRRRGHRDPGPRPSAGDRGLRRRRLRHPLREAAGRHRARLRRRRRRCLVCRRLPRRVPRAALHAEHARASST